MNSAGKFYDGKKNSFYHATWQQWLIQYISVPNNTGSVFQLLSKVAVKDIIVLCLTRQACCQLGHTIINKPDFRQDARFLLAAPTIETIKYIYSI